jgi:hypothetical protein
VIPAISIRRTGTPNLDGKEIGGSEHVPVGLEKLAPGHSLTAFRGRIDPIPLQDVGNGRPSNPMTDVVQGSLDSGVTPACILPCHSNGQLRDDLHDPRPTRRPSLVRPLLGDELPMPAQDRVGSDERGNFEESSTADLLSADSQPATRIIGQSESSAAELLSENSVFLAEILDYGVLMTADPAREAGDEDLPWLEHDSHPRIVTKWAVGRQLPIGPIKA